MAACNAAWRRLSKLCNRLDNISCGVNRYRACDALALHYGANVADLELEIKQLNRLIARYEDAFFETKLLLSIACTLPVTSAEISLSSLKLIKTQLMATMGDARLSSIAVISVHKKRAKEVVDEFV